MRKLLLALAVLAPVPAAAAALVVPLPAAPAAAPGALDGLWTGDGYFEPPADTAACRLVLDSLEAQYRTATVADVDKEGKNCPLTNVLSVSGLAGLPFSRPTVMTCQQALRTHAWLTDVVKPMGQIALGTPVEGVHHAGALQCRRVAGDRRPSEHAFANAFDIWGFSFERPEEKGAKPVKPVRVLDDWADEGPRGAFLRRIARLACRYFRVTLTPLTNAAHKDHLHLDGGRARICNA